MGVLACALYLPHAHFVVCNHPLMCAHVSIIVARTQQQPNCWKYTTRAPCHPNTICGASLRATVGREVRGWWAGQNFQLVNHPRACMFSGGCVCVIHERAHVERAHNRQHHHDTCIMDGTSPEDCIEFARACKTLRDQIFAAKCCATYARVHIYTIGIVLRNAQITWRHRRTPFE